MNETLRQAIEIVTNGGIVIFPTDTAFGIGCRIDDEKAVRRLFALRKREETKATPVLVDSIAMAQEYLLPIPADVKERLMEKYWPGQVTIVLPCMTKMIPEFVRGKGVTLGVRLPDHDVARELIRNVGVPILGTSANFAGEKTPYSFEELDPELVKLVDMVVPGECSIKQASTVIDCSVVPWEIRRQGAVSLSF